MKTYIYALRDFSGTRYIGKTLNLKHRLRCHISDAKNINIPLSHRINWLRSIILIGQKPEITILEICDDNWQDRERWWIQFGKSSGWNLTNATDGGDKCFIMTDEVRKKISDKAKTRLSNPINRERNRLAQIKAHSDPVVRAAKKTQSQKQWSDKNKRTIKSEQVKTFYINNPEMRQKISQKAKEQWANHEFREKMCLERKKQRSTPEFRAKMSEAAKKREAIKKEKRCAV